MEKILNTEKFVKTVLNVFELTQDQIRQENRGYNPLEWDKIINRFSSYKNVKFYVARKQRGYDYDRYFATYETSEGLKLFTSVSYSSTLSNAGFVRIVISGYTLADGSFEVSRVLLKDVHGNEGRGANDKESRMIMVRNSQNHGCIFSNEF